MMIDLRFTREQFSLYAHALENGQPLIPPAGGWSFQELCAISVIARGIAFRSLWPANLADDDSIERLEFYDKRRFKLLGAAWDVAIQLEGEWRSGKPCGDVTALRLVCENVDESPKIIPLE
jgi:hypothetical protein